ncbi:MAG: ATP-binding protein [Ignavibacteriaceae bacterium]|nr:ATP-binding protein [Ignavibacteriaceae bacterium]
MKPPDERTFELKVKSSLENLAVIRDFISDSALDSGINKEVVDRIILAVDEASSNIMRHAYKDRPEGVITVQISVKNNECVVTLIDNGIGFSLEKVREPNMLSYLKEKKRGGLGIHLMKILMDNVDYSSIDGEYNKLVLTKKIN